MPTWNKELHSLTKEDIEKYSIRYLMGWHNFSSEGHGFRLKGFNNMRQKYGLDPLTKELSDDYRVNYVLSNFSESEIFDVLKNYMSVARVDKTRWTGIYLFDCRFGSDYAKLFKRIIGSEKYSALAEYCRNQKSIETQTELYGGIGLAGEATKQKAIATNLRVHGGENVMDDPKVRANLARSNMALYGGISPFCDRKVREKSLQKKDSYLFEAMQQLKQQGFANDVVCESHPEFRMFCLLLSRFGKDDVFSQYGVHPSDARYPYNCDFYIKSLDIFIEINLFYTHGYHWYNDNNADDVLRVKNLLDSGLKKNFNAVNTWTVVDVEKRNKAKQSGINYLVFWGGKHGSIEDNGCPFDFNLWFFDYNCDYAKFVNDFPGNTY